MVANLARVSDLWNQHLDQIEVSEITSFIEVRQAENRETTTIHRELATLRRMFKLAVEWNKVSVILPKVRLLPGENRRERVISQQEERAYLENAVPC